MRSVFEQKNRKILPTERPLSFKSIGCQETFYRKMTYFLRTHNPLTAREKHFFLAHHNANN